MREYYIGIDKRGPTYFVSDVAPQHLTLFKDTSALSESLPFGYLSLPLSPETDISSRR